MTDEAIKVEEPVEDIAPVEIVVEEPVQKPEDDVQASIDLLKKQLEDEKNARLMAEARAQEAASREMHAQKQKKDSDLQIVVNAIQTVKTNNDILQSQGAQALAAGDYTRFTEIQRELAANEYRLQQLETGRVAMEEEIKNPKPVPQPVAADPVEALASQLTPRSADWVRRHPEFARDQSKMRQMIAAHELAVSRGIQPDTDDYFSDVESTLRIKPASAPVSDDPMEQAAQVTQRRSSPAAAPVSRGSSGPKTMSLTAEEREMASMMKMSPEDYAKQKARLIKEGKIGK